jgi:hypothetical protein
MDAAIETLQSHKDEWVAFSVHERIALLDRLITSFAAIAPRWVDASSQAKGIADDPLCVGEEWAAGVWPVLKNLRQLRQVLVDIEADGQPRIPGPVKTRLDGQVVAQVFPQTIYDRLFFQGIAADIWMEPGVTVEYLPQTQAVAYRDKQHEGKVALVLGAGNVASIGPMDVLYKLFVEDQVVLFKTNPVNAYIGTTTWGAFPGHEIHNIQSGTGVVHNTLMFSRPQKSVLRGPFRSLLTPPWFVTHGRTASKLFPRLVAFEAAPSPLRVPGILWAAICG